MRIGSSHFMGSLSRTSQEVSEEPILEAPSDSEIRAKIALKEKEKELEVKNAVKKKPLVSIQKEIGEDEAKASGAIGLNDPNNPETHEKLKSILKAGAFNFSEKEKKALSSILGSN